MPCRVCVSAANMGCEQLVGMSGGAIQPCRQQCVHIVLCWVLQSVDSAAIVLVGVSTRVLLSYRVSDSDSVWQCECVLSGGLVVADNCASRVLRCEHEWCDEHIAAVQSERVSRRILLFGWGGVRLSSREVSADIRCD